MKDNKLKDKLKFNVPKYDAEAYEQTMRLARSLDYSIENHRMTEIQSIIAQVKFIPAKTWLLKIIIAFLLNTTIMCEIKNGDIKVWMIMSIFIPLLCLVSVYEVWNIIQPALKGLLMTVRYSIKKVLLIRLILFGICDFLIVAIGILYAYLLKTNLGWDELLNVIALYNLMCAGCIFILNRVKEAETIFYCAVWGGCLATMTFFLNNTWWGEVGGDDTILLFIIALSIWKLWSEVKHMIGGIQQSETSC